MKSNDSYPVLIEIFGERHNQDLKWGEQNHPDGTGPERLRQIISRRDAAKTICDREHKAGHGTWEQILTEEYLEVLAESDPELLRAELIQLAAVAVEWVEHIDRRQLDA